VKEEIKTLVLYRLQRAHEAIEEAKILLKKGHTNTCVNRLYYACFYAVSALLLLNGLSSAKHSGVRSLFHQNFVKNGVVNMDLGHIFDKLFDNRQKGDYADLIRFEEPSVRTWLDETKIFVDSIASIILRTLDS
jgi:uncharacterized protein